MNDRQPAPPAGSARARDIPSELDLVPGDQVPLGQNLREVEGAIALPPDMPVVARRWACRSDDHWYDAEVTVAELGMTLAYDFVRFDCRGPGPLHPKEAIAAMNAQIGRAALVVTSVVLHEVDVMAYSDLGPTGRE